MQALDFSTGTRLHPDAGVGRRPDMRMWAHVAGMFVFALEIPLLSQGVLIGVALFAAFDLAHVRARFGPFLWRLGLLIITLSVYFVFASGHGFVPPFIATARAGLAIAAYIAGFWAGDYASARRGGDGALAGAISAIVGSAVFAVLCVRLALEQGMAEFGIVTIGAFRGAPSPWGNAAPINAPGLGALGGLGMGLVPMLLFAPRAGRRRWLLFAVLAGTALLGFFTNLVLQNRTPLVAVAAAVAIGAYAFFRSPQAARSMKTLVLLSGLGLAGGLMLLAQSGWFEQFGIFHRFESEGFETARYELWGTVLSDLFQTIDGGRATVLTEAFAHNLWLDVAWDSGPFPFFGLLAFHASHALPIARVLRSSVLTNQLLLIGVGIALMSTSMAEPVLYLSVGYFSFFCYLLGVVLATSLRIASVPRGASRASLRGAC